MALGKKMILSNFSSEKKVRKYSEIATYCLVSNAESVSVSE